MLFEVTCCLFIDATVFIINDWMGQSWFCVPSKIFARISLFFHVIYSSADLPCWQCRSAEEQITWPNKSTLAEIILKSEIRFIRSSAVWQIYCTTVSTLLWYLINLCHLAIYFFIHQINYFIRQDKYLMDKS